ncbi:MAG: hypothetical protein JSV76_02050 [Candidatus Bathyarchaeota archaeon]|nr:MAG: hypothetical protein JSV76_02050 [Candidatus Bathyarchaeota archaeon]
MKFIWYWEWDPEDIEEILERSEAFERTVRAHPDAFPKLSEPILTGKGHGFRIIEAKNEAQLMNLTAYWWPYEDWTFVPYFDGLEYIKIWRKWNRE